MERSNQTKTKEEEEMSKDEVLTATKLKELQKATLDKIQEAQDIASIKLQEELVNGISRIIKEYKEEESPEYKKRKKYTLKTF